MNKPLIALSDLQSLVKRRKTLAIAAAVGVAGCNMLGQHATPEPDAAGRGVAQGMINSYTSDIEQALDNVDRKRLEAARQAGQTPRTESTKSPEVLKSVAAPLEEKQIAAGKSDHDVVPAAAHGTPAPAAHAPAPAHNAPPAASTKQPDPRSSDVRTVATPTASGATLAGKGPLKSAAAPAAEPVTPTLASDGHGEKPAAAVIEAKPAVATASPMNSVAITAEEASPSGTAVASAVPPPASAMASMTAMVNTPAGRADAVGHAASSEPSLDDALAVLRKSIGTHPTLNTALALALLDGSKGADSDMAKMLSEPDQKVLTDLLTALDSMKSSPAAPSAAVSQRAAPLVDAAKKWQADSDLALPCLSLATRVDSYGVFTAVTPTFEQGRRHTVIVYCEVANFGAKRGEDGWYTTRLTQQESLITEDKLLVWRPNPEEVEDRSLNQRHDFYLVKKLTLPETLAAGKYTLRMDVTDANTGKRALQNLEIQIVAK